MAKKQSSQKKTYRRRRQKITHCRRMLVGAAVCILMLTTVVLYQQKIRFLYSICFDKQASKSLLNSASETRRINTIIANNSRETFGIDLSHYQESEDINWEKLSIGNGAIPIKFVVLRATMGAKGRDKNFTEFSIKAKTYSLLKGAYHYYRPDEDPVVQANNFIMTANLEDGDLAPVLDIENLPKRRDRQTFINNLQIWLNIVEKAYHKKPIVYTYFLLLQGLFEEQLFGLSALARQL